MARTAAFYFTELPDAYATRTGRPENVGVIGVAVFREAQPAMTWRRPRERSRTKPARRSRSGAGLEREQRRRTVGSRRDGPPTRKPRPAHRRRHALSKLGTGHGRSEDSPAQMVRFERESTTPNETIAIYYDRRENLVAMGILPPPVIARSANPFPAWPHFVPDPPNR